MKFKTTRKAIVNGTPSKSLYYCGYCDMYYLLKNHSPIAYTCGVYGWNFDVYSVYGITITTGYRNMCGRRIPYELLRSYEKKAREIAENYFISYEQRTKQIESLLVEFIEKLQEEM